MLLNLIPQIMFHQTQLSWKFMACAVLYNLKFGVVVANLTQIVMWVFCLFAMSRVGRSLEIGRSLMQGVLLDVQKWYSETQKTEDSGARRIFMLLRDLRMLLMAQYALRSCALCSLFILLLTFLLKLKNYEMLSKIEDLKQYVKHKGSRSENEWTTQDLSKTWHFLPLGESIILKLAVGMKCCLQQGLSPLRTDRLPVWFDSIPGPTVYIFNQSHVNYWYNLIITKLVKDFLFCAVKFGLIKFKLSTRTVRV